MWQGDIISFQHVTLFKFQKEVTKKTKQEKEMGGERERRLSMRYMGAGEVSL